MATTFILDGPYPVPFYRGKAGRSITDEDVRSFWKTNPNLAHRRGCYVFGVRAGRGMTPGYVGSATKTFKQEVFAPHKLNRYQQFLVEYARGTPILFFVLAPSKKGAPNATHIKELEDFLIQTGVAANSGLLNIKGTKAEEWGIAGVLRGGRGKPSKDARDFRKIMKLGK
jgi:hypothetical protein